MLKDNISRLRNVNGYSQEEVAEKIGISRQAYAKWEKGNLPSFIRHILPFTLIAILDDTTKCAGLQ